MTFKLLTYNNGVGLITDANLLRDIICENITNDVSIVYIDELKTTDTADVGIWIQNIDMKYVNNFKFNIYFVNEEWLTWEELNNLRAFDVVICKSKYTQILIKPHADVIYLPFISPDCYNPDIIRTNKMLNFTGRSIQKNTELLLKLNHPVTLIDPSNRYQTPSNITHINSYQSKESINWVLNEHDIHVCISLYESWGHYLFEGLSTGAEIICSDIPVFKEQLDPDLVHFIPTTENKDCGYMFDGDNINDVFPLRKSFYVDVPYYRNIIENFVPIGKSDERRKLFNDITTKNKNQIVMFLKSI